jgi:hypothetical protein
MHGVNAGAFAVDSRLSAESIDQIIRDYREIVVEIGMNLEGRRGLA